MESDDKLESPKPDVFEKKPEEFPDVFGKLETSKKPRAKRNIKNWIILILAAALILTWVGPYVKDINITGAFTADYSEQGLEDGSYFQGAEDAPVKMILFTDFQCPFCARFSMETLPQIREEYVKTGKVKFVFKNLPLDFHNMAETAAWAAICAGKQGMFWEYHDKIFENQGQLSREYFESLAEELSLDLEDFEICFRDRTVLRQITLDEQAAGGARISGTPAFLIDGELMVGAQPFSAFKEVIDRKLSE